MRLLKALVFAVVLAGIGYLLYRFVFYPWFFHSVRVVHVINNGSVLVQDGDKVEKVLMIGVDTRQFAGVDQNCFQQQSRHLVATQFFQNENELKLTQDSVLGDKQADGTLLRYVWLKNGDFLNEKILSDGYATQYLSADKKYQQQDRLSKAAEQAKSQQAGFYNPAFCGVSAS